MSYKQLLQEMKDGIGTKDPLIYFNKLTDVFNSLFEELISVKKELKEIKTQSALAIEWDPRVASLKLAEQIEILRQDKDIYHKELSAFKLAYSDGIVTQSYKQFCKFWQDTLGYHPFLNY